MRSVMKKILGTLSVITLMLVCLTGCGSISTLECNGEIDGQKVNYVATLKGDNVTEVEVNSEYIAESEEVAKTSAEYLEKYLANIYGDSSETGISITSKAEGKKVISNIKLDVKKLSKSTLDEQFGNNKLTKKSFKEFAEDSGLTCK